MNANHVGLVNSRKTDPFGTLTLHAMEKNEWQLTPQEILISNWQTNAISINIRAEQWRWNIPKTQNIARCFVSQIYEYLYTFHTFTSNKFVKHNTNWYFEFQYAKVFHQKLTVETRHVIGRFYAEVQDSQSFLSNLRYICHISKYWAKFFHLDWYSDTPPDRGVIKSTLTTALWATCPFKHPLVL